MIELKLLLLIGVVNGAPILARRVLGRRFRYPIDANWNFFDGRPVLGSSKTWIGLCSAMVLGCSVAPMLGMRWIEGFTVAAASMLGDLLSSFTKRRAGLEVHSRATGLDQIPECLLPALAYKWQFGLSIQGVLIVVVSFFIVEILLSRLLYQFRIRRRPY